ncbi:hypothetical protein Tco_0654963 [Tanacetum coccineum]|uniref:Uncharacterized protein n=1 Tax=Tanacetum coccineum TaxID=301880 RepID=A0ABQ4X4Q7_9ASTR
MLDGKLVLVDYDGKLLKRFYGINEFKVDNNSKSNSGVESKSMYEQWIKTYVEGPYDDGDFDDRALTNASLKFANVFDISLRG